MHVEMPGLQLQNNEDMHLYSSSSPDKVAGQSGTKANVTIVCPVFRCMTGREQGQSTARHARSLGYAAKFLLIYIDHICIHISTACQQLLRSCGPCMVTRYGQSFLGRLLKAPKAETVSVASSAASTH